MQEKQILNVSRGIWIDARWLHKAGLGSRLQVELKPGEIRIHSVSDMAEDENPSEKGWEAFLSLGNNAVPGRLENAAQDHDRYLYGKEA